MRQLSSGNSRDDGCLRLLVDPLPKLRAHPIFRYEQIRNGAVCRQYNHDLPFPSISRLRRIFSRFGVKKFPAMLLREFARNQLTNEHRFQGQTAAEELNRQDSRLFSRFTGISAAIRGCHRRLSISQGGADSPPLPHP
jgi:hypothetical protein